MESEKWFYDTAQKKLHRSDGSLISPAVIETLYITHKIEFLKKVKQFLIYRIMETKINYGELRQRQLQKYRCLFFIDPKTGQSHQCAMGADLATKESNFLSLGFHLDQTKTGR